MDLSTSLDIINTILAAAIPLLILFFGYRIDQRQRKELQDRQEEQDTLERKHKARIQLELDATFFEPQKGMRISDISVIMHNKGIVRNIVDNIRLKICGIEDDTNIDLFNKKPKKNLNSIANFPIELVNTNILESEDEDGSFFVEPGIVQRFSYAALIPDNIRFILVRCSFRYHRKSEHSAQKVFEIKMNKK